MCLYTCYTQAMKIKNQLIIIILALVFFGCGQSKNKENKIEQKNYSEKEIITNSSLEPKVFLLMETSFNINGISLIDTFNLETYIDKIGKPDKIERGGQKIIDEFGFDDYEFSYSKNRLVAGHGYLLNAYIFERGISFNGIEIGNNRIKIEQTFKIETMNEKSIQLISSNDQILRIELNENGIITELYFTSMI